MAIVRNVGIDKTNGLVYSAYALAIEAMSFIGSVND